MQINYQCKKSCYQVKFDFPSEFNVAHTKNHWSNKYKAMEFIKNIIMPYIKKVREELGLRSTKDSILISNIFKGQWVEPVLKLILDNFGKLMLLPGNLTSYI